jgi:hypothetical protein
MPCCMFNVHLTCYSCVAAVLTRSRCQLVVRRDASACLLSRRSEDVSLFFGRASVHCEDLLDYWFH